MKIETKLKFMQAAWLFGAAFLGLLGILHLLKPEFGPTWRMISEYEIGDWGWMMRLAFFCWAAGFIALTISIWSLLGKVGGIIGKWWLLIIGFAVIGAGIFVTQPITDLVRGSEDKLHSASGAIMIFTFPFASTLLARQLSKVWTSIAAKRRMFWATVLVWIGFLAFFGAILLYSDQAKTRAYNPEVLIGLPNRFMVITYTIWLIVVSRLGIAHLRGNKPPTTEV